MRRITADLFISVDGVVEDPHEWHFPYFNDEMGAAVSATLGAADTVLPGRKTSRALACSPRSTSVLVVDSSDRGPRARVPLRHRCEPPRRATAPVAGASHAG